MTLCRLVSNLDSKSPRTLFIFVFPGFVWHNAECKVAPWWVFIFCHEEEVDAVIQWLKGRSGACEASHLWPEPSVPKWMTALLDGCHVQASPLWTCLSSPPAQPALRLSEVSGLGGSLQLCVYRACSFSAGFLKIFSFSPASQTSVTHNLKCCSLFSLFLGAAWFSSLSP